VGKGAGVAGSEESGEKGFGTDKKMIKQKGKEVKPLSTPWSIFGRKYI
jgi:hypothetical protein